VGENLSQGACQLHGRQSNQSAHNKLPATQHSWV